MKVGDITWETETYRARQNRRDIWAPHDWSPCSEPKYAHARIAMCKSHPDDGWNYCEIRGIAYRFRVVDENFLMVKMSEGAEVDIDD